jgi:hypothetical protein
MPACLMSAANMLLFLINRFIIEKTLSEKSPHPLSGIEWYTFSLWKREGKEGFYKLMSTLF